MSTILSSTATPSAATATPVEVTAAATPETTAPPRTTVASFAPTSAPKSIVTSMKAAESPQPATSPAPLEPDSPTSGKARKYYKARVYRGVVARPDGFHAVMKVNGRVITIKKCATEEEAACVYDRVSFERRGERAILNFPERMGLDPEYKFPPSQRTRPVVSQEKKKKEAIARKPSFELQPLSIPPAIAVGDWSLHDAIIPPPTDPSLQFPQLWCIACRDDPSVTKCEVCGCRVCNSKNEPSRLLMCDGCEDEYHLFCLSPPLKDVPEGAWFCKLCVSEGRDESKSEPRENRHCRRVDRQQVFADKHKDMVLPPIDTTPTLPPPGSSQGTGTRVARERARQYKNMTSAPPPIHLPSADASPSWPMGQHQRGLGAPGTPSASHPNAVLERTHTGPGASGWATGRSAVISKRWLSNLCDLAGEWGHTAAFHMWSPQPVSRNGRVRTGLKPLRKAARMIVKGKTGKVTASDLSTVDGHDDGGEDSDTGANGTKGSGKAGKRGKGKSKKQPNGNAPPPESAEEQGGSLDSPLVGNGPGKIAEADALRFTSLGQVVRQARTIDLGWGAGFEGLFPADIPTEVKGEACPTHSKEDEIRRAVCLAPTIAAQDFQFATAEMSLKSQTQGHSLEFSEEYLGEDTPIFHKQVVHGRYPASNLMLSWHRLQRCNSFGVPPVPVVSAAAAHNGIDIEPPSPSPAYITPSTPSPASTASPKPSSDLAAAMKKVQSLIRRCPKKILTPHEERVVRDFLKRAPAAELTTLKGLLDEEFDQLKDHVPDPEGLMPRKRRRVDSTTPTTPPSSPATPLSNGVPKGNIKKPTPSRAGTTVPVPGRPTGGLPSKLSTTAKTSPSLGTSDTSKPSKPAISSAPPQANGHHTHSNGVFKARANGPSQGIAATNGHPPKPTVSVSEA